MSRGNAYDLRDLTKRNWHWFWTTNFYLIALYKSEGYDDDEIDYALDTANVLFDSYIGLYPEC